MRKKASKDLHGQIGALVAAAEAASRWFLAPSSAALSAARTARLRARAPREAAVAALRGGHGPVKAEASGLSFALREAIEQTVAAVSEAARWGLFPDAAIAAAAAALKGSALALSRAASCEGASRLEALVEAKRLAAEVERRRRDVRGEALDSPVFVESVKRSEVVLLLSAAAESVQQSCDFLAGSLAE